MIRKTGLRIINKTTKVPNCSSVYGAKNKSSNDIAKAEKAERLKSQKTEQKIMNNLPKFYVSTYPDTYWLIPVYIHQFNKYIPNAECTIMCYEYPDFKIHLTDNVKIISITDGKTDPGISNWASSIRKYFETIKDKYIILSLDDYIILDHLDAKTFSADMDFVINNDIKRYALGGKSKKYYEFEEWNGFLRFTKNSPYRISAQVSVWNREYLMRYLRDDWTPWDFEIKGATESRKDDAILVYKMNPVLLYQEQGFVSRRYKADLNVEGIKKEDLQYHIECGNFDGKTLQWGMGKPKKKKKRKKRSRKAHKIRKTKRKVRKKRG